MKRHFIFAVMSAVALMGLTAVTSCSSSSDEVENVNPGYDPATGEVPVNFVLNVSTSNTPTTRQSSAATQANMTSAEGSDVFRGIKDAHILTFKRTGKNGEWISAAETADKDYDMALVAAAASLSKDKSTRVLEMALPLKTNTMVFYGRADGNSDKNKYGHLEVTTDAGTVADGYHVEADLDKVYFHLGKRLTAADKVELLQIQKLLAGVMTCIMNTNRGTEDVSASDTPDGGVTTAYNFDVPNTVALKNLPWSDMVTAEGKSAVSGDDLKPLEEKLVNVYKELTTIQEAELRNGSGPAIKTTVENLWSIVNSVRCASPTDEAEAFAKYMAALIHDELDKYFGAEVMPVDGGSVRGLTINKASQLITSFESDTYWPTTAGVKPGTTDFSNISAAKGDDLAQFPEKFDLPQGATHIKFDATKKSFYYVENFNQSAVGSPETTFTVDDYYYPAELLYFGNSPLRVSDTEHVVSAYPTTTANWDTEAATETDPWYGWTPNSEVQSSTRSVAMRNDINYGTALLKTTVGYASGVTTLKDNNTALHPGEEANEITPTASTFILKGIVIGGQSPRVGWNFLPALATGEKQGYIFDKDIPNSGAIPATGESQPTYTLVFDNYDKSKEDGAQNKVFVALEFLNNSHQDFYGKANLIPHGSNFYLVGELDMTGKSITESNWPTYHALPPYTSGTEMKKVTRAFIQDFMTSVSFKIGANSLKYAYLTVPDLRSSSVTLGLSVDMSWSTGLVFNDVILGGGE